MILIYDCYVQGSGMTRIQNGHESVDFYLNYPNSYFKLYGGNLYYDGGIWILPHSIKAISEATHIKIGDGW